MGVGQDQGGRLVPSLSQLDRLNLYNQAEEDLSNTVPSRRQPGKAASLQRDWGNVDTW